MHVERNVRGASEVRRLLREVEAVEDGSQNTQQDGDNPVLH